MSEYVVGCSSHNVQAQHREELIYCTILDLQVENWIFTVFLRALKTRTESGVLGVVHILRNQLRMMINHSTLDCHVTFSTRSLAGPERLIDTLTL